MTARETPPLPRATGLAVFAIALAIRAALVFAQERWSVFFGVHWPGDAPLYAGPSCEALQEVADSDLEEEAEAATEALEEMLFYASADEIPLFNESQDSDSGEEDGPWDSWFNSDDPDLGTYG